MSFRFMPTRVKCVLDRRSATLVRGTDEFKNWDTDPKPRHDLDPVCMEVIQHWIHAYDQPGCAAGSCTELNPRQVSISVFQ
ncbi:MAG: hypothetical protein ACI9MU_004067 [Alphaproteobacteria bacterium]|jgi:hypothetical protein